MEPEIFKMKPVGRVANRPDGPKYMQKIKERAKQLETIERKQLILFPASIERAAFHIEEWED